CVICLESISESCKALPCQHSYDYICLLTWLELRQTCPLCNATVQIIEVFDKASQKLIQVCAYTSPHQREFQHRVEPPPPCSKPVQNPISTFRNHHRRRRLWNHPPERISTDIAILRRQHVYRTKMRCLHVGSNRISRFRNFTPRMLLNDEELQSRAKMFIRRELQVFEWTNENAEFILEYIIGILKTVDLKASTGAAEDMLTDFLGRENAGIFCHEIHAFLRSPFTSLESFDGFVQYE
ncbi:hypothetical protein BDD12DRAFT_633018, partial [Trichophaea hybrida]